MIPASGLPACGRLFGGSARIVVAVLVWAGTMPAAVFAQDVQNTAGTRPLVGLTTEEAALLTAPDSTSGDRGAFLTDAVRLGGHANVSGELYRAGGIEARRPGSVWRMNSGVTTSILGGMTLQADVVASTEGVDFRQDVNQLGLTPTWWWGSVSAGDFAMDYSPYVLRGTRVRGGGVMINPGSFRVSAQGGRLQRAEAVSDAPHQAYDRNMIAARGGVGRLDGGSHVNITLLKGWDTPGERGFVAVDTLFLDTIPEDLRPEVESRPQESLVAAVDAGTALLAGRITLRGEVAASLLTRDRESALVDDAGDVSGAGEQLGELADVRVSTTLDHAYRGEARARIGAGTLDGRYERVGAGYGSLGLPYLVNDLRDWQIGGGYAFLAGRLALQGRYLDQTNNLEDHRRNTVDRRTVQLNVAARPVDRFTASLSGMRATMRNDAVEATQRLDNVTTALTANLGLRHDFLGLTSNSGVQYSFQLTESDDDWIGASWIVTHSVGLTHSFRLGSALSLGPSVTAVLTRGTGLEERRNLRLGFRGNGRFLADRLSTTASVSHATSQGRDVFGAQGQLSYPVVWGTSVSAQLRHMRYTAMGQRPAFDETFISFALSRSF